MYKTLLGALGVEIYDPKSNDWAQGKYLVRGADDVLWTDDLDAALEFLRDSCCRVNTQIIEN